MDNLKGDKVRMTEAREGTDDEAGAAISLIVSLVSRGYQPEHIMGILTDAICQALVLFSPTEEVAINNFEGSVQRIMSLAVTLGMFKERTQD